MKMITFEQKVITKCIRFLNIITFEKKSFLRNEISQIKIQLTFQTT
jgi:hypothetical protein